MVQSIQMGHAITLASAPTFADGVAIKQASEEMRQTLAPLIDQWLEVDEQSIETAVLTLLEKAKILAEGSGAIPLASLEQVREQIQGKKIVLIVSGGNIDASVLTRIMDRAT
jgi:threonine dehydratase